MLNLNLASIAVRGFSENAAKIKKVTEQMASGKRVNVASDDPSSVGILSSLKIQQKSLEGIKKNLGAGASLLEVSEKALQVQQSILTDMRELAIRAKSGTLSSAQRTDLQATFLELQNQLDSTINKAKMFGASLLEANSTDIIIQTGATPGEKYTIKPVKSDSTTLGINANTININSTTDAEAAMNAIEQASITVASNQGSIGNMVIGIKKTEDYTKTMSIGIQSSISKIEDADIAELTTQLSLLQNKQQLISSTISIANNMPNFLMNLIR